LRPKDAADSDRRAVAIAGGFVSDQAVHDISEPADLFSAIQDAKTLNADDFKTTSILNSPELKQME